MQRATLHVVHWTRDRLFTVRLEHSRQRKNFGVSVGKCTPTRDKRTSGGTPCFFDNIFSWLARRRMNMDPVMFDFSFVNCNYPVKQETDFGETAACQYRYPETLLCTIQKHSWCTSPEWSRKSSSTTCGFVDSLNSWTSDDQICPPLPSAVYTEQQMTGTPQQSMSYLSDDDLYQMSRQGQKLYLQHVQL